MNPSSQRHSCQRHTTSNVSPGWLVDTSESPDIESLSPCYTDVQLGEREPCRKALFRWDGPLIGLKESVEHISCVGLVGFAFVYRQVYIIRLLPRFIQCKSHPCAAELVDLQVACDGSRCLLVFLVNVETYLAELDPPGWQ